MLCLDQCLQKFINKTVQGGKRLLFNSDPWPPAEQKLEMPCDNSNVYKFGYNEHQFKKVSVWTCGDVYLSVSIFWVSVHET